VLKSGTGGVMRRAALIGAGVAAVVSAVLAAPSDSRRPGSPPAAPGAELLIEGVNENDRPLAIWVRADGPGSRDFGSRANLFRAVPPGAFRLFVNRADLVTPAGAPLDLGVDPSVRVFAHDGAAGLSDVSAVWVSPETPPAGVIALDFGAPGGPVFPGFTPANAEAPEVAGRRIVEVTRPGADALARDGLAGVETITLAPPPGRYRVKLWLEDLGAWEYMPHALRHRVRINGRTILDRTDTPGSWVRDRWLAGVERRIALDADAWSAFGARRMGLPSESVEIGPDGLRVELAGDAPGAVFVAALAVVPEADAPWLDSVERNQAERFRARWPVDDMSAELAMADFRAPQSTVTLAPGGVGWVRLDAGSTGVVALDAPRLADALLPATLRLGVRRLDRPSPNSPALSPLARDFRAPDATDAPDPLGRPALIEIRAPLDAAPGRYRGALRVDGVETAIAVDVVAIERPQLPGRSGFIWRIRRITAGSAPIPGPIALAG
jgi:hypothetical protein